MKENEYLSMAQEMITTNDYTTRRIYFYGAFEEAPEMKIYPQLPLVSYQTLIAWKILGDNLWGPRLFNVLFGVMSILVIYRIGGLVFQGRGAALFCAFLLAVMPLAVFFSRNLQPESPAFFFMLLGNLFYLKFIATLKKYNLILGGLSFSLACIYKLNFLFGAIPFIFCFPFKTLFKEKKEFFRCAFILLPINKVGAN
jgi:4-amino-4-deoxy-L-arabinose transferase-like glycosyltransferase